MVSQQNHTFEISTQQVRVQLPTYADNVALPAFTRHTLQQSIDSSRFAVMGPCWDGQTDGRTPYRFIDPASHTTMRAVPITVQCATVRNEMQKIHKRFAQRYMKLS